MITDADLEKGREIAHGYMRIEHKTWNREGYLAEAIALALAEQREKDAKVAEEVGGRVADDLGYRQGWRTAAHEIAAAIRNSSPTKEK
jgi:hypothetical protein